MTNNTIHIFLKENKVPHTKSYLRKLLRNNPNSQNMYGMKNILKKYGIETVGVAFTDKQNSQLSFPCILHLYSNEFIVATDLCDKTITYVDKGVRHTMPIPEFMNIWSGSALLTTNDVHASVEPEYKNNLIKEIQEAIVNIGVSVSPVILLCLNFIFNNGVENSNYLLNVGLSICGILLCFLLLEKELRGKSYIGDKICTLMHGDCNGIIGSHKKIGIFQWSEIGMGFFISCLFLLSFNPATATTLAIVWCAAMGFGLWSVYQQLFNIKKVCVLCMLVQFIVFGNGILIISHYDWGKTFSVENAVHTIIFACLFFSVLTVVHAITMMYAYKADFTAADSEFHKFKIEKDVFLSKLQQKHLPENIRHGNVILGNKEADIHLTVITNPLCNPCANMHKRISDILNTHGDKFRIEFIFTSFGQSYNDINRYLIGVYQQKGPANAFHIYDEWYGGKRSNVEEQIKKYGIDIHTDDVENEMSVHKEFVKSTGIIETPSILVNDRPLPDMYEVEDLIDIYT